jgi:EAL domain-containing protein (putative c-di-GMP-specific phosphodiesterase class I)
MVIDKSEKQRSIVRSIISLAYSIGLPLIAEGVENTEHVERLLRKGCQLGQGFYYSPPMSSAEAEQWLEQHRAGVEQPYDSVA